jgi:PleD family two-component response regulator
MEHAKLSGTLEKLESWNAWDDITALANHQTVKSHLLGSINEIRGNGDLDVRLYSLNHACKL